MTIGYGDISARCTTTRGFSMVVMLLGSSMYAYSLNYLMTYLNSRYVRHASSLSFFFLLSLFLPNPPPSPYSILRASNIIGDRMVSITCPPTHPLIHSHPFANPPTHQDAVNSFVHFRNLPPKLRSTVHEYFQKVHKTKLSFHQPLHPPTYLPTHLRSTPPSKAKNSSKTNGKCWA